MIIVFLKKNEQSICVAAKIFLLIFFLSMLNSKISFDNISFDLSIIIFKAINYQSMNS
jgi:hypothetical protein